jgi:hypothetical protein
LYANERYFADMTDSFARYPLLLVSFFVFSFSSPASILTNERSIENHKFLYVFGGFGHGINTVNFSRRC